MGFSAMVWSCTFCAVDAPSTLLSLRALKAMVLALVVVRIFCIPSRIQILTLLLM